MKRPMGPVQTREVQGVGVSQGGYGGAAGKAAKLKTQPLTP